MKHDIINIIGFNSPEWFFSNYGAIMAGGIAAGIYATNQSDACQYISKHSEAKVVVADGLSQLEKYYSIAKELPHLKAIVVYGPGVLPDNVKDEISVPVYMFDDFLKLGENVDDAELKKRGEDQQANEVTTLIYTSGTTGPPKAVMITHDNVTWTAKAQLDTLPQALSNDDHLITYLPLSHIAAQILDMHCPMASGVQVWFAQPDALRGSLGATLKEVRPTTFFGVPRVWEKIYEKMQEAAKSQEGIKKMIATTAKKNASAYWNNHQFGGTRKKPLMYGLSRKIFHKVKVQLGLDRVSSNFEVQLTLLFTSLTPSCMLSIYDF